MTQTFRVVSGSDITGSSSNRSNTPLDWSKTTARNSCVQQTILMHLKEPDIKLSLKHYKLSMTLVACQRM